MTATEIRMLWLAGITSIGLIALIVGIAAEQLRVMYQRRVVTPVKRPVHDAVRQAPVRP